VALTVETGAGLPEADSYATTAELQARAAAYGGLLPPDTGAQEVLLRRAAVAMNAQRWEGCRSTPYQPLAWPRLGVPGVAMDAIPLAVKQAQCALAVELYAGDTAPEARGPVLRERVDVLEVEYAAPAAVAKDRQPSASLVLAGPYLRARSAAVATARA